MLDNLTLTRGIGDGKSTACLMSARALLDGRPFGDDHPSAVLRGIGIGLNDGPWWPSDAERTVTLLPLALDERLCASVCDASPEAERLRAEICAHWALATFAPMALDAAAEKVAEPRATKLHGWAERLREEPTRENAAAAAYAADAADAACAAYTADTADAAVSASAAYAAAAYAAYAAYAACAAYTAAYAAAVRDSMIALFNALLDVRA